MTAILTFGNSCLTFGNDCYNKGDTGNMATKKDYIRYVVLEDGCRNNNNFYSQLTTGNILLTKE